MTAAEALAWGAAQLQAAGVDSPRLDARLLLAHAAGLSPAGLLRDLHQPVQAPGYEALLARRATREPLAYLLGAREFWSLPFQVSPATLIPRPDSEAVVEAALAAHPAPARVLDLGTGTGCLLLAILHERPDSWGVGTDLNPDAARLAALNAERLGLADRAAFLCAEWAAPLCGRFDLIVSNPPYIRHADLSGLMPEVAHWEPVRALDGGADGMDAYRQLCAVLPRLLAEGGAAVLELGAGQDDAVARLARETGLVPASTRHDLGGVARAMVLRPLS